MTEFSFWVNCLFKIAMYTKIYEKADKPGILIVNNINTQQLLQGPLEMKNTGTRNFWNVP